MTELKTKQNDGNVDAFLASIEDAQKRQDAEVVCKLMQEVTGEVPKMWGASIVGFGEYTYKYSTGRTGDWMITGFSPRKQTLTLYIMNGYDDYQDLLARLGKHSTAKSCLYIKHLSDIDIDVLREIVSRSVAYMRKHYPTK